MITFFDSFPHPNYEQNFLSPPVKHRLNLSISPNPSADTLWNQAILTSLVEYVNSLLTVLLALFKYFPWFRELYLIRHPACLSDLTSCHFFSLSLLKSRLGIFLSLKHTKLMVSLAWMLVLYLESSSLQVCILGSSLTFSH